MMTDNPSPQILVFYCANAVDANALRMGVHGTRLAGAKTVSLPCSGKINLLYLLKAFEKGVDAVFLVTCPEGECRFMEGNARAFKRAAAVNDLLREIGFSRDRLLVIPMTDQGLDPVLDTMIGLITELEPAGTN